MNPASILGYLPNIWREFWIRNIQIRNTYSWFLNMFMVCVDSSWNVMAHGDAREEKWRGSKRMEWVTSRRHMTAEHRLARAVKSLQADVHSSAACSRLNWCPRRFKWTRPFRRKTKSGFCACVITHFKRNLPLYVIGYVLYQNVSKWNILFDRAS